MIKGVNTLDIVSQTLDTPYSPKQDMLSLKLCVTSKQYGGEMSTIIIFVICILRQWDDPGY